MLSGDKQSEPPTPHPPPRKSGHPNSNGVKIRPLDKDYYSNQQIPPGILLGLSSSSKGIKDSNGHTAIRAQRTRSFGVEFVKNYPYSQYSAFLLSSAWRCTNSVPRISRVGVLSAVWPHHT